MDAFAYKYDPSRVNQYIPPQAREAFSSTSTNQTLHQEVFAAPVQPAVTRLAGTLTGQVSTEKQQQSLATPTANHSPPNEQNFLDGATQAVKDTGSDAIAASKLAWQLMTDSQARQQFATSVEKIVEALQDPATRQATLNMIGSELGKGIVDAFQNFSQNPSYYSGYLMGTLATGGAIGKLAKVAATAAKLDELVTSTLSTIKRIEIKTEGLGSNGGNIRVGLRPNTTDIPSKPTHGAWKQVPNFEKWVQKGGSITPNSDGSMVLTNRNGNSVTYNPQGYPDFSPHMNHPSGVTEVGINGNFSKNRTPDYTQANRAVGHPEWGQDAPRGYTWHHHEDGNTMQLVPLGIHSEFRHQGGISNLE